MVHLPVGEDVCIILNDVNFAGFQSVMTLFISWYSQNNANDFKKCVPNDGLRLSMIPLKPEHGVIPRSVQLIR